MMTGYMCGCRLSYTFNKQCLHFQWNGFTFVQFIYIWWHEKQPLKCFKHSFFSVRYNIFSVGREIILYILYLYVFFLRTRKHNWKYVCVYVNGEYVVAMATFFMEKNRYYMTATHISQNESAWHNEALLCVPLLEYILWPRIIKFFFLQQSKTKQKLCMIWTNRYK